MSDLLPFRPRSPAEAVATAGPWPTLSQWKARGGTLETWRLPGVGVPYGKSSKADLERSVRFARNLEERAAEALFG